MSLNMMTTERACLWNKPNLASAIQPLHLDKFNICSGVRFHWAYHNSIGIHINHMIFLNTYLLGVFIFCGSVVQLLVNICLSMIPGEKDKMICQVLVVISLALLVLAYGSYVVLLAISFKKYIRSECPEKTSKKSIVGLLTYMIFVILLTVLAFVCVDALESSPTNSIINCSIGFSIILGSFGVQLLGHWCFEYFNAKPDLWHGFVAAPVLEWISFLHRCGSMQELDPIWKEVLEIRERNLM